MGKHRDWSEIEKDYQENGLSYSQLAEKYGIKYNTLKKAAQRQGWTEGREKLMARKMADAVEEKINEIEENTREKIPQEENTPEKYPDVIALYPDKILPAEPEAVRFQRLVDELMNRVEDAICNVDVTQAGAVKLLTGALKDLRSLKGLDKSPLDIEEQKARIEKLKSEAAIREVSQEPVIIRFVDLEGAEA